MYRLTNAFSYWQAQELSNSTHSYIDDLFQAFARIQSVAGTTDIEIWNGETGWPCDGRLSLDAHRWITLLITIVGGSNYGAATAGTKNAQTFFKEGVCAALDWGFNVFYFEAFDEPWKPASVGDDGTSANENHWGAFTADRKQKFPLTC